MKISELFYSIQGEGKTVGKPAIFIRFAGCNLRCNFCDSKYTWNINESEEVEFDEVIARIKIINCKHIIFTGGEPLLREQIIYKIINNLSQEYTYEIETNGTIQPKYPFGRIQFNVSPKLENSGNPKELREKAYCYKFFKDKNAIFKFVIDKESDLEEVLKIIATHCLSNEKIYLMPEGVDPEIIKEKTKWVVEICKRYNFNFSPRMHISIWGNKRAI